MSDFLDAYLIVLFVIWVSFWSGYRHKSKNDNNNPYKKVAVIALIFAVIGIFTLGKTEICRSIEGYKVKINSLECFEQYSIDPSLGEQELIFIGVFLATFLPFVIGRWISNFYRRDEEV